MRIVFSIALIFISSFQLFAQAPKDSIVIHQSFFGPVYKIDGRTKTVGKIFRTVKQVPAAIPELKKAKSNFFGSILIGFVAGGCMGYGIVSKTNGITAAGVALMLVTIPIDIRFKRHLKSAITIYNEE
ncbi:MAG: hypothetical protein HRT71_14925 [Flavobacteriales bacterium]|nr:hypothetical protein [Flavobacteriales bacterium]